MGSVSAAGVGVALARVLCADHRLSTRLSKSLTAPALLAAALGRIARRTGSVEPDKIGGYKPRKIAGAHRDSLVRRCREADFTLRGLVAELGERGLKVDYRSVWEFVHREKLSHKKRR
jgi:hypothetical protein